MGTILLVGKRLFATIPVLVGVTALTFFALNLLPGSAAQQLLGAEATAEQVARLEAQLELDLPPWQRYWTWISGALAAEFGNSLTNGRAVTALVGERLPVTLELISLAFLVAVVIAVPLALLAARRPSGTMDRIGMTTSMIGLSVPSYVIALLLVLVFAVNLRLFPSVGFTAIDEGLAAHLHSIVLPVAAMALPLVALYSRFLRGDLLEQMQGQDYVLTAKAKGMGPWQVLVRHALRNSLLGLLTVIGLNFGALISGAVIIEQIFGIPGIGQLLLQAINLRDVVVVQAIVLVLAVETAVVNLAVDVLYAVLDPRVRHGD